MKVKSWRLHADQVINEAARHKLRKTISHAVVAPNAAKRNTYRTAGKVRHIHTRNVKTKENYTKFLGVDGLKRFE